MVNVKELVILQGYAVTAITQEKDQHIITQGYFSGNEPPPSAGVQTDIVHTSRHPGTHASSSFVGMF